MQIFLSLGSNIDPAANIQRALDLLAKQFGDLQVSPIYRCPAEGFAGDDFYNLAVACESELPPLAVVDVLRSIEDVCGRDRSGPKFSARTLDIDLLTYGDKPVELPGLRLPRADILEYAFVLKPLADLAPKQRHPLSGRTYAELWSSFSGPDALIPINKPEAQ